MNKKNPVISSYLKLMEAGESVIENKLDKFVYFVTPEIRAAADKEIEEQGEIKLSGLTSFKGMTPGAVESRRYDHLPNVLIPLRKTMKYEKENKKERHEKGETKAYEKLEERLVKKHKEEKKDKKKK